MLKKLYGKDQYKTEFEEADLNLIQNLPQSAQLIQMIDLMHSCQTYSNYGRGRREEGILKVIHDACYRYSRAVKEKFFQNSYNSFLFLLAKPYLDFKIKRLKETEQIIELKLRILRDFSELSNRVLKKN